MSRCLPAATSEVLPLEELPGPVRVLARVPQRSLHSPAPKLLSQRVGSQIIGWCAQYVANSVFSFSDLPIKGLIVAGAVGLLVSTTLSVVVFVARLMGWITVPGYAPIVLAISIGSRRAPGAEIGLSQPAYRVIAGRFGNLFIRAAVVPGFADTQAGFKVFRGACAQAVFSRAIVDGWVFDVEALVIARHLGFGVGEAPIRWDDSTSSKVRAGDYLRVLRAVWCIRQNLRAGVYD